MLGAVFYVKRYLVTQFDYILVFRNDIISVYPTSINFNMVIVKATTNSVMAQF